MFEETFARHGWRQSWRDGIYDFLHFHSATDEVLGFARGKVTIEFGGRRGRTLTLHAGDVAVLPAGIGHRRVAASDDLLLVGAYPAGGHYDEPRPTRSTTPTHWPRSPRSSCRDRIRSMAPAGR